MGSWLLMVWVLNRVLVARCCIIGLFLQVFRIYFCLLKNFRLYGLLNMISIILVFCWSCCSICWVVFEILKLLEVWLFMLCRLMMVILVLFSLVIIWVCFCFDGVCLYCRVGIFLYFCSWFWKGVILLVLMFRFVILIFFSCWKGRRLLGLWISVRVLARSLCLSIRVLFVFRCFCRLLVCRGLNCCSFNLYFVWSIFLIWGVSFFQFSFLVLMQLWIFWQVVFMFLGSSRILLLVISVLVFIFLFLKCLVMFFIFSVLVKMMFLYFSFFLRRLVMVLQDRVVGCFFCLFKVGILRWVIIMLLMFCLASCWKGKSLMLLRWLQLCWIIGRLQ